ncbi:uncharacterized protein LOC5510429 isoform X2 [Nematostella vectensis]|uniref:uncharacterized protein LOC5510429 isoform X2 n=1 Tax=Nematostella vectensis TaxID=45351 RepID=UPI0020775345|nr:uncharacterized protein LOC5510429 isoform X2 [Nematostella vectensis]
MSRAPVFFFCCFLGKAMPAEEARLGTPSMKRRTTIFTITIVCGIGVIFLITGIVLFAKSTRTVPQKSTRDHFCDYSVAAESIDLEKLLQKVQDAYYRLHPHLIYLKPKVTAKEVRTKYKAYDPLPVSIKERTEKAGALYEEIKSLGINTEKMKKRERKALSQVQFFLKHIFSTPYAGNYYAGDWMMGPDLFCYHPVCNLPYEIEGNLLYFAPSNVEEYEEFKDKLAELNQTIWRYRSNLELGVHSGMVGADVTCEAGLQAFAEVFPNVYRHGAGGILQESFVQAFLKPAFFIGMQNEIHQLLLWRKKYDGMSVGESMRTFMVDYLGTPIDMLYRFLKSDYKSHCVPSSVSSGLSKLPLPYVYTNGKPDTSKPTSRVLPTGEPLNGSRSYEIIMPYFTTNDMTPDEVYQVGLDALDKLYLEALKIAREITGNESNETAKAEFIKMLNQSEMFWSDAIPQNESDKRAHEICQSVDMAMKFCPTRWKAIQAWFKEARQVMSTLAEKTVTMFHFTGKKRTTPSCPVRLEPDFIPVSGAQSYMRSDGTCQSPATYFIPFFLDRPGPKYEEWSINAHEARPGHHTQDQGFVENFQDSCGGLVGWVEDMTRDSFTAFTEGWGLYAEYPLIAQDTDVYRNEPLQRYGMLKWQIWRALRLIVDTGLHHRGMTRQEALQKFAQYAWTTGDTAEKELTRYQSNPGQATAYMIGQRHIIRLREHAQSELGDMFNLKDLHFEILSQGTSPLSYLDAYIRNYVECVKNKMPSCGMKDLPAQEKPQVKDSTKTEKKRKDFVDLRKIAKPKRRQYI